MKYEVIKKIIIKRCAIIILIGAAACVGFSVCMSMQAETVHRQIEEEYANKYDIQTKDLDFLNGETESYKDKVKEACEAYDLIGISRIATVDGSVTDNKEKGAYEWKIICNDTKDTSFTCEYKKSTKEFTIERVYAD